jgi:hypothetical protein
MKRPTLLSAAALLALSASTAQAQQVKPLCTDNSRTCLIRTAQSYLESIVHHDGSKVPVTPTMRRTENGIVTADGEKNFREVQPEQPDNKGHANTRFFVDEEQGTVIYYTLFRFTGKLDPTRKTQIDNYAELQKPFTTHMAERIKVENGLISEIEVIFENKIGTMDDLSGWPDKTGPKLPDKKPVVQPDCTDNSRACLIAAAKSYLDAVTTHDGTKVLAHPDVRRTQNGRTTAEGDVAIRASMEKEPDMLPHKNTRWFVDRDQDTAIAFTLLIVQPTNADSKRPAYSSNGKGATTHLAERFRIQNGVIAEIEAVHTSEYGRMDGQSGWPDAN